MNKKNFAAASLAAVVCIAGAVSSPASAGVLQGVFDDIFESNFYTIGSGANSLSFEWSTAGPDDSGYFYAGGPDAVAVYIAPNLSDPKTITDAASFAYQGSGAFLAKEGDSVFLRSGSGVYGAVALRDFVRLDPPVPAPGGFDYISTLDANWYVDTAGTGDFSAPAVPEPSAYALMIAGLALVAYRRRARRTSTA